MSKRKTERTHDGRAGKRKQPFHYSHKWLGPRHGYVFKTDSAGTGYYKDIDVLGFPCFSEPPHSKTSLIPYYSAPMAYAILSMITGNWDEAFLVPGALAFACLGSMHTISIALARKGISIPKHILLYIGDMLGEPIINQEEFFRSLSRQPTFRPQFEAYTLAKTMKHHYFPHSFVELLCEETSPHWKERLQLVLRRFPELVLDKPHATPPVALFCVVRDKYEAFKMVMNENCALVCLMCACTLVRNDMISYILETFDLSKSISTFNEDNEDDQFVYWYRLTRAVKDPLDPLTQYVMGSCTSYIKYVAGKCSSYMSRYWIFDGMQQPPHGSFSEPVFQKLLKLMPFEILKKWSYTKRTALTVAHCGDSLPCLKMIADHAPRFFLVEESHHLVYSNYKEQMFSHIMSLIEAFQKPPEEAVVHVEMTSMFYSEAVAEMVRDVTTNSGIAQDYASSMARGLSYACRRTEKKKRLVNSISKRLRALYGNHYQQ